MSKLPARASGAAGMWTELHPGPRMKFEIRPARNGVYQEIEDVEVEAFADFLRRLVDHYGPTTSRYSPKRIHVVVEPGDKYEPQEEE